MTAGAHYCQLHLYKNGADAGFTAYSDGRSKHIDSSSMSVVLGLMTGDRLWVYTLGCEYLYGRQFASFSGYKI